MDCKYEKATDGDEANDVKIIKFFTNLNKKAIKSGGAVYSLLGNHEIMNLENYYMYAIDDVKDGKIIGFGTREERIKALKPSSSIGKWLREKDLIYKWKDDTIFVLIFQFYDPSYDCSQDSYYN